MIRLLTIGLFATGCWLSAHATLLAQSTAGDANADPPRKLEKVNGVYDLTFDDIKFDMDKDAVFDRSMLTDRINTLDGERMTLRGFIRPSVKQSGITKFIFVRDNQECCFGPGAALCDCVLVTLRENHATTFTVRPITITGVFYVKEYKVQDRVLAVFRMKDAVVN